MNLKTYFQTTKPSERDEFATKLGVAVGYLYLCARGTRKPSSDLCKRIVKLDSRFTLAELRPDIWGNGIIDSIATSDDTQPPVGGSNKTRKMARMEKAA
ncbi:hypothetical protein [Caballeronia sp. KNU42]